MMRVREIAREDLERVEGEEWVDRSRRPFVAGNTAYVPVKEGFPFSSILPDPRPYRGRGYRMLGTVAVFQGRSMPGEDDVRAVLKWKHPTAVLWIPICDGQTRKPRAHILAGTPGEVAHRECGITYFFDPSRTMFSSGNRGEKERLKKLVRPGERVADMFAGIGYFSLPVAREGARVHAMEIDPVAFSCLAKNIDANGVADRVFPQLGDCRFCLSGTYDRIIMGHFDSCQYLDYALSHVREGSVLHVHTAGDASGCIGEILSRRGVSATAESHRVKKLGPHIWHCVQDVTVE
jgi:tRNA wybutosine-synthesizing protein 2